MASILTAKNLKDFPKRYAKGKKVVLVGGCFDILHPGHVMFLQKAKKAGDLLVVILESDEKVRLLKGERRPVHNQKERAMILSALMFVDFIVLLPFIKQDQGYDKEIKKIKPDIIAVTEGISNYHHQRISKLVGAKLKYVTKIVGSYSSSRILSTNRG